MKPEEVQSLFSARLDVFDPILKQPTDADLMRLHKDLTSILFPLPYNLKKGIHNLMGLVMDEDDYKVLYGAKFLKTIRPSVYDKYISNNATNVVWSKAEAFHTAKIADYWLFVTVKRETRDFILSVKEDTWVRKFCEPFTLYTAVSPSGLLAHLQVLCGVNHALNLLALWN